MSDDLARCLSDPGFTPGLKLVPALLEQVATGDERDAKLAAAALARVQLGIGEVARRALLGLSREELRRALAALAGRPRGVSDPALVALCAEHVAGDDPAVRIAAARVLGKLGGEAAERALAAQLARTSLEHERAALARALGKTGTTAEARAALAGATGGGAALARARLMVERSSLRDAARAEPALSARPARPPRAVVSCRRGLEPIVREELRARVPALGRVEEDPHGGRLELELDAGLDALLSVRTALRVGYTFSADAVDDEASSVAALLASPAVVEALSAVARGPVRFRLELGGGGKQRGAIWRIAEEVARLAPAMVNDPTHSDWDFRAWRERRRVHLDALPRVADRRFAYRVAEVPAASHPTIAAALTRVAGAEDDDVVWDPFVGSGLELCERALLGPYRALYGTDVDPVALDRAQENLDAAGATATLLHDDARYTRIAGLSCVITNPPMGRRVLSQTDLPRLLEEVVASAAQQLVPGGRLVLLSPHPRTTQAAAERAGLEPTLDRRVDMSGFDAVLQRFDRPRARTRSRAADGSAGSRRSPRPRG